MVNDKLALRTQFAKGFRPLRFFLHFLEFLLFSLLGFGNSFFGCTGELGFKSLNAPCGVQILHLSGVEGVAVVANVDFYFGNSRPNGKSITAGAGDLGFGKPLRMDGCFHKVNFTRFKLITQN